MSLTFANVWYRRLPREVRYLIYEFAIADDHNPPGQGNGVLVKFKNSALTKPFFQKFTLPKNVVGFIEGMFAVNKELHAEATAFFYAHQFMFDRIIAMQTFLMRGPSQILSRIRHITLTEWELVAMSADSIRTSTFALLHRVENLETFSFPSDLLRWYQPRLLPRRPNETLAHAIGKTHAAIMYRYAYPYLGRLIDDGGLEQLLRGVCVSDQAFVESDRRLIEGLEHDPLDSVAERQMKQTEFKHRIQEARKTMMNLIIKLHQDPQFRESLMKPLHKGKM